MLAFRKPTELTVFSTARFGFYYPLNQSLIYGRVQRVRSNIIVLYRYVLFDLLRIPRVYRFLRPFPTRVPSTAPAKVPPSTAWQSARRILSTEISGLFFTRFTRERVLLGTIPKPEDSVNGRWTEVISSSIFRRLTASARSAA